MKKHMKTKLLTVLMVALLFLMPATNAMAKTSAKEGLIDIGGKSLYAKIMGKDNGTVSVVFDSGYGDGIYTYSEDPTFETWGALQKEISKYAKTITFDRLGMGKSDKGTNRPSLSQTEIDTFINSSQLTYDPAMFETGSGKTALDKARDLHALLKASHVDGPYLLVVHSIAMLTAVEFAKEYPTEVAGIVSVDGSWPSVFEDALKWARINMPEIEKLFVGQFTEADGTVTESILSELQVRNAGDVLRDIPFTILHPSDAGMGKIYQELTDEAMKGWTEWSDTSELIMVPKSGHYIMKDQPNYVKKAVKNMLKQILSKDKK